VKRGFDGLCTFVKVYYPVLVRSMTLKKSKFELLYDVRFLLSTKTESVNYSKAGPPFLELNLIPKS